MCRECNIFSNMTTVAMITKKNSIQGYFLVLFFLRKLIICEYKEEIFMSSFVMIVSEFSNRIETVFSYQTPVGVCTVSKKKQLKK